MSSSVLQTQQQHKYNIHQCSKQAGRQSDSSKYGRSTWKLGFGLGNVMWINGFMINSQSLHLQYIHCMSQYGQFCLWHLNLYPFFFSSSFYLYHALCSYLYDCSLRFHLCLFVGLYMSQITQKITEPICTILGGRMGHGPGKNSFNFWADPGFFNHVP